MKSATARHQAASLEARITSAALLASGESGCSGINASESASESISTVDFFLPGLRQSVLATPVIPNTTNPTPELAQAAHDLPSMKTQPNYSL